MSIFFNYNGKFFTEDTPVIGPDNRGLRFGDGLFETMKMVKGKILFADEHFERLINGMKVLQFAIPVHFSVEKMQEDILHLAKKNNHELLARIRLTVIRGNGGLFDAENHLPNYIIQTWQLADNTGELNSNGLVLGIFEDVKKSVDKLSNVKHNNYLPCVLSVLFAQKNKYNDAVVLNSYGRVCETSIANIFFIKNETIFTPKLSEGCVAGVYRQFLLSQFAKKNIHFIEKEITIEELLDADEVFLTNSISNIRWVKQIGEREYSNNFILKISGSLH